MDFLAEANGPGQLLLRLVSRGNAILAELLRLSDNIPQGLLLLYHNKHKGRSREKTNINANARFQTAFRPENSQQYAMLIFDFSYLQNEELYEKRIIDSSVCNNKQHTKANI